MKRKMRYAKDAVAVHRAGLVFQMRLPKRHRFVSVMEGHQPSIIPIAERGIYQINMESMSPVMTWPVLIFVVPVKDAELFAKASIEEANGMIAQARLARAETAIVTNDAPRGFQ